MMSCCCCSCSLISLSGLLKERIRFETEFCLPDLLNVSFWLSPVVGVAGLVFGGVMDGITSPSCEADLRNLSFGFICMQGYVRIRQPGAVALPVSKRKK